MRNVRRNSIQASTIPPIDKYFHMSFKIHHWETNGSSAAASWMSDAEYCGSLRGPSLLKYFHIRTTYLRRIAEAGACLKMALNLISYLYETVEKIFQKLDVLFSFYAQHIGDPSVWWWERSGGRRTEWIIDRLNVSGCEWLQSMRAHLNRRVT